MLVVDDLLLLLTRPGDGRLLVGKDRARLVLAGALLVELEAAGRLTVDGRGRLAVLDGRPTGDALLDEALAVFGTQAGRKPKNALPKMAKDLPAVVYGRLVTRGEVVRQMSWSLGIFPRVRHPVTGPRRPHLLGRATDVLLGRAVPDLHSGSHIALLDAGGAAPKVFAESGLRAREVRARAKEVRAGAWASEAVRKAISDAQAAVTAATVAAIAVAGSSG